MLNRGAVDRMQTLWQCILAEYIITSSQRHQNDQNDPDFLMTRPQSDCDGTRCNENEVRKPSVLTENSQTKVAAAPDPRSRSKSGIAVVA